jgi:hypothetical protein
MASWEREFNAGNLNEVQSRFFLPKPPEELYDVTTDPHNIKNLVDDPAYSEVLNELRQANRDWLISIKDVGFIPEAMVYEISANQPMYNYAHSKDYNLEKIVAAAETASSAREEDWPEIKKLLSDPDPIIRYWAATGCLLHPDQSLEVKNELINLSSDQEESLAVRVAAAEVLYKIGSDQEATTAIIDVLKSENMMARVQAINVLDIYSEAGIKAKEEVQALLNKVDEKNRDYDIRAARRLLERWENNS